MATPTLKRSWGFAGLSGNDTDTGNNFKVSLEPSGSPCAVVSGDLVLVSVAYESGVTATVSDDQSNTWTSAISATNAGISRKYNIFWASAGAGTGSMSTITVGFGGLTTNVQIAVVIFYNCATSSPIDGAGKATTGISPANNTPPNVSAGSFSFTSGDLIYNIAFDEGGGTVGGNHAFTTSTPIQFGSGFTGLYAETTYGAAAQYQVVSGTSINPGMTFSQSTHDTFASLAIAILPGTGGGAPTAGIRINRSQMAYILGVTGTTAVPFPATGNQIVVNNEAGNNGCSLTGVTDSNSNSYTEIAGAPSGFPQPFLTGSSATTGNSLVVTFTTSGGGNDLIAMYDIANSGGLDTAAIAANSSTLTAVGSGATSNFGTQGAPGATLTDAASITPSTATGLLIDAGNIGTGPASGCVASHGTYDYVPATWNSGGGDQNGFGNGDFMAHYFPSSTSAVNFEFTTTNGSASAWQALALSLLTAPPTPAIIYALGHM